MNTLVDFKYCPNPKWQQAGENNITFKTKLSKML